MHKIVDGEKVELSSEEEEKIKAEWEENSAIAELERNRKSNELLRECKLLRDSGFKDEAIAALRPDLKHLLVVKEAKIDFSLEEIEIYKAINRLRLKGFDDETIAIIYPDSKEFLKEKTLNNIPALGRR